MRQHGVERGRSNGSTPASARGSCGQTGLDDWDRIVIDGLAPHIDFHSIHLYTGSADYWSNVLAPHYAQRALSVAGALIDRARYVQRIDHEISVAYDEWNVWYRTDDERLEERYNLADALAVGTYLNVFVRQSWPLRMANLAQLVNVIAPIVTSADGMFTQSIYHPFQLMATASQPVAVDNHGRRPCLLQSPPFPGWRGDAWRRRHDRRLRRHVRRRRRTHRLERRRKLRHTRLLELVDRGRRDPHGGGGGRL